MVALLIDGENCSPEVAAAVLARAGEFGNVQVRRVYANWALPNNRGWMEPVARYDIRPIHHEPTATGKNATDILLAVDAVELLYTSAITCFCLVASDSDYTPLVARLRAADRTVVVIGRARTLPSLVQASSVFISLEELAGAPPQQPASSEATPPTREASSAPLALAPAPTSASLLTPDTKLLAATVVETIPAPATKGTPALAAQPSSAISPKSSSPIGVAPAYQAAASPPPKPTPAPTPAWLPGQLLTSNAPEPGLLLIAVWESINQTYGEVSLAHFVSELQRRHPELNPKTYGHSRLAQLIRNRVDLFTVHQASGNPAHQVVRMVRQARGVQLKALDLLEAAWQQAPKQNGWLFAGALGQQLRRLDPNFKPSQYGFTTLGSLLQAFPNFFELRQRADGLYEVRLTRTRQKPS